MPTSIELSSYGGDFFIFLQEPTTIQKKEEVGVPEVGVSEYQVEKIIHWPSGSNSSLGVFYILYIPMPRS